MNLKTLSLAALALGLTSSLSAAFVVGDTIVVDLGKNTEETVGNWNNLSNAPGSGDPAPILDAIRFSDGASTGVGISMGDDNDSNKTGIGGATVGAPATTAGLNFPGSGAIPRTALVDLSFFSNEVTEINQVVFSNLDDSLFYDLSWVSSINATRLEVTYAADGQTVGVDPSNSAAVFGFSDLKTDGNGNLVLSILIENDTANALTTHINAMELQAVGVIPEPSTVVMILSGVAVLFMVIRRRR